MYDFCNRYSLWLIDMYSSKNDDYSFSKSDENKSNDGCSMTNTAEAFDAATAHQDDAVISQDDAIISSSGGSVMKPALWTKTKHLQMITPLIIIWNTVLVVEEGGHTMLASHSGWIISNGDANQKIAWFIKKWLKFKGIIFRINIYFTKVSKSTV